MQVYITYKMSTLALAMATCIVQVGQPHHRAHQSCLMPVQPFAEPCCRISISTYSPKMQSSHYKLIQMAPACCRNLLHACC